MATSLPNVAVVGAGTMGADMAVRFAASGCNVVLMARPGKSRDSFAQRARRSSADLGADDATRKIELVSTLQELPWTELDLVIENGDDRPLRFDAIHVYQTERVLVAHLQPGMSYHLTTGDPKEHAPNYDLARFEEPLTPIDTLTHGALTAIPQAVNAGPAFDPSQWWVWALILTLMAGMGWMAVRMLRKAD